MLCVIVACTSELYSGSKIYKWVFCHRKHNDYETFKDNAIAIPVFYSYSQIEFDKSKILSLWLGGTCLSGKKEIDTAKTAAKMNPNNSELSKSFL